MKKNIKFITLCLLLFFTFTGKVSAKDEIEITNWNVRCDILDEGSILVNEYITFKFSGSYNGVFREIKVNDTDGIENLSIIEKGENGDITLTEVDKGKNGQRGVYERNSSKEGENIKIYSPSENTEKTFNIVYKVKNVCKKYQDIGELYYSFLGQENKTPIKEFNVNISFPYEFNKDEVKIFGHGPLNGVVKFINNSTVNLNVKNVGEGNLVAARLIFPKEYIKNSSKVINTDGYNKIIKEENAYAQKIKDNQLRNEKRSTVGKYISIILSILGVLTFIFTLIKSKREDVDEVYTQSTFPEECTPAVLSYFYYSTISPKAVLATILDLNRRGYLKIEEIEEDNLTKKRKDKIKNYKIMRTKMNLDLLDHERYFMNWIIDDIGDGYYVTTEGIKEYSKKHSSEFYDKYTKWSKPIKEEVKKRGYFDLEVRKTGVKIMILSIIMIIISIPLTIFSGLYGALSIGVFVILLLWGGISLYNRKTPYGKREYDKWNKLKKDITKNKKEELFEAYPMDKYLIYSLVLGVEDRRLNEFKESIERDNYYYNNNNFLWFYFYAGMFNSRTGKNEFSSSIDSAFISISPSSGAGGGFTGGGGGAGGGGAGGF
ncbi:MAG: DUF2207 domain-containing protein [Clostridiaceae bacterium]